MSEFKPIRVFVDGREIEDVVSVNERAMTVELYPRGADGKHIAGCDGVVTEIIAARHEIRLTRG